MGTQVLSPARATREDDVGSQVETWAESWNILTQIDPAAEALPDSYQKSALRMILCGNINTHVDLSFSKPGPEPTMAELMGEIRRYAGIKRSEVWVGQGRNAMEVDAVAPKEGERDDPTGVPSW